MTVTAAHFFTHLCSTIIESTEWNKKKNYESRKQWKMAFSHGRRQAGPLWKINVKHMVDCQTKRQIIGHLTAYFF